MRKALWALMFPQCLFERGRSAPSRPVRKVRGEARVIPVTLCGGCEQGALQFPFADYSYCDAGRQPSSVSQGFGVNLINLRGGG